MQRKQIKRNGRNRACFFGVDFFGVLMIVAAIFSMLSSDDSQEVEPDPAVQQVISEEAPAEL